MYLFWSFHFSERLIALPTLYPNLKRKLMVEYQDSKMHLDSSHLMNSNLSADMWRQRFIDLEAEDWLKHHHWSYFCSFWCSFLKLACYLKGLSAYLKEEICSWDSPTLKNILQGNCLFLDVYNSKSIVLW